VLGRGPLSDAEFISEDAEVASDYNTGEEGRRENGDGDQEVA